MEKIKGKGNEDGKGKRGRRGGRRRGRKRGREKKGGTHARTLRWFYTLSNAIALHWTDNNVTE